ncbi:MAG: GAF domain-containing protein [Streptococcus sp.]|nr:GAF domain-containing protein [Streptococcus sp.]
MQNSLKKENYQLLIAQAKLLFKKEKNWLANLSNASAMLNMTLPNSVFTGFYVFNNQELILGPFQGGVSCVHIPLGKGVCGESAQNKATVIVDNVKSYPNYISCDSKAMSEIVVPLLLENRLLGVLDLDSSLISDYDDIDKTYLEEFVDILVKNTEWPNHFFGEQD